MRPPHHQGSLAASVRSYLGLREYSPQICASSYVWFFFLQLFAFLPSCYLAHWIRWRFFFLSCWHANSMTYSFYDMQFPLYLGLPAFVALILFYFFIKITLLLGCGLVSSLPSWALAYHISRFSRRVTISCFFFFALFRFYSHHSDQSNLAHKDASTAGCEVSTSWSFVLLTITVQMVTVIKGHTFSFIGESSFIV